MVRKAKLLMRRTTASWQYDSVGTATTLPFVAPFFSAKCHGTNLTLCASALFHATRMSHELRISQLVPLSALDGTKPMV
jgi:hypothetical protein